MVMWSTLESRRMRLSMSAAAAFLGYGAWAYVANASHGVQAGIQAAVTQGGYAFFVTLLMSSLLEGIYRWAQRFHYPGLTSALITCAFLYLSSWGVNFWAGTPEILWTILPGMLFGTLYTLGYVSLLEKLSDA